MDGMSSDVASRLDGASVQRARRIVQEARAGWPAIIVDDDDALLVLPAETATMPSLAAFAAAAAGPSLLVLPSGPAQRILRGARTTGGIAALRLSKAGATPELLRALADPTSRPQPCAMVEAPAPRLAEAALHLARRAYLLPAVLVAPVAPVPTASLTTAYAKDLADDPRAAAAPVRVAECAVPLDGANDARLVAFRPPGGAAEHLALLVGRPEEVDAPLVRLHSQCFTGDVLGSLRCDCGPQLRTAIRRMSEEGAGVLLYMAQEGRGIGLVNKLRAYALQDLGLDTFDANLALGWGTDERMFAPAAAMLVALGITRVRLLTNNPDKIDQLAQNGIDVASRVSHAIAPNGVNDEYLETKARRFGHLLEP